MMRKERTIRLKAIKAALLVLVFSFAFFALLACKQNPDPTVTPTDPPSATPTEAPACTLTPMQTAYGTVYYASENGGGKKAANVQEPMWIQTKYARSEPVVALLDVVAFGADPTGVADSSVAILKAIRAVSVAGGGTLWFPEGYYRITMPISVSEGVTLKGEYADPDTNNGSYGAVLLIDIPSEEPKAGIGTIEICASAGIDGMTIYYPGQSVDDVKPYPYTFCFAGGHLRTLRNVTMLNSYRGIFVEEGESPMLENVKGTILSEGVKVLSTADVGSFNYVTFSPRYWAGIPQDHAFLKPASYEAVRDWAFANESRGLNILDVEQQQFTNVTVEGFAYGIVFAAEPTRFMGSGFWYNTVVRDCKIGVYAEAGTWEHAYAAAQCPLKTAIDWRGGYAFSGGSISGSEYAVLNNSSVVKDTNGIDRQGYIRLAGVTIDGKLGGYTIYTKNGKTLNLSGYTANTKRSVSVGNYAFIALYNKATEEEIQTALDKVGNAGGGIVYLSGGAYQITDGLEVPAHTALLGAAGITHRDAIHGTRLYCRAEGSEEYVDTGAMVTLAGANSGVGGLFFLFDENIQSINDHATYAYYYPAVRGIAQGAFAYDLCIAGANEGIVMENADRYLVRNIFSGCINTSITLSGNDGLLYNSLNNGTVMFLTGVLDVNISNMYTRFFERISLLTTTYIKVGAGKNQTVVNVFSYGIQNALKVNGAENLLLVNFGTDNVTGVMFDFKECSATLLNPLYTNPGRPYRNTRADVRVYNAITDRDIEEDIIENFR